MAIKHRGYRFAVQWLVRNDDTVWLHDANPTPSAAAALVADLYEVGMDRLMTDMRREYAREF